MSKYKVIYTHVGLSSFVTKDIEILQEIFDLKVYHFNINSKAKLPFSFLKQFFWLFINIWNTNGSVTQFAGYQSFLPTLIGKMTHKKSIIVLGGTDTVNFPSIKYGCFYNKKLAKFTKQSLQRSTLLLPVSETLIKCPYTYNDDDFDRQGYLAHAPNIVTPVTTIYNGYKIDKWHMNQGKESLSFVTIGANLGSRFGKKLKGIDLILAIAPEFPSAKFYIVGGQALTDELPSNVIAVVNMPHDALPAFIGNKQFYLQLSMSEGFPNSLCEAMLSGCVPIVSAVGAMPMIVGSDGYILHKKDPAQLNELIQRAIDTYSIELAGKSRQRIIDNFPFERRKKELQQAILAHLQS